MAVICRKWCLVTVLLVISAIGVVRAEADVDTENAEATIEVEEDDQYHSPQVSGERVYLAEHFDDENAFKKKWIKSEAKKQGVDENIAKYDGMWEIQLPARKIFKNDYGLVLTTEAKHAAISTLLNKPFEFKDRPLVVQYEVTMQEGQNCGGAYIKLLSRGTNTKADLRKFHDQTPYTIMFGPDKCGNDNKLHFIFRHKNLKNGTVEEKHSKKPTQRLDDIYKDKEPHLYTLIVRPDNTFSILVDNKEVNSGSLLEDFTPPVNPPEEIDDPNDKKPEDWDEREKIVDPTATKPEDWDENAPAQIVDPNAVKPDGWLDDEPEMIPDPDAQKPEDWDDDMDGEWEAPLIDNPRCSSAPGCGEWAPPTIPNPNYKGIWRAPLVPNPNYKGKWAPRRIPNPDYFKDDQPFKMTPIHAVGFELWSMSPLLLFDNLLVSDDEAVAQQWAAQSFSTKRDKMSRDSQTLWGKMLRAMNYKPGYWAIYIIYVMIPISFYVYYLLRTATQDSFVERGLKFAAENPWVYALLIVIFIVFVALIYYVCSGTKTDSYGEMKKTDALADEDPHQSDAEVEGEGDGDGDADAEEQRDEPQRASKADLEGPEFEAEGDSSPQEPAAETSAAGDGHRRRKPRKE